MWEDENCKDGGRWVMRVPKTHSNLFWENLILAMIGEQFTSENEILGIVISLRPYQDTISIWNKHSKDAAKVQQIKEDIQKFIQLEEGMKLDYESFADVLNHPEGEGKKGSEKKQGEQQEQMFTRGGGEKGEGQQHWRGGDSQSSWRGNNTRGGRGRGGYSRGGFNKQDGSNKNE